MLRSGKHAVVTGYFASLPGSGSSHPGARAAMGRLSGTDCRMRWTRLWSIHVANMGADSDALQFWAISCVFHHPRDFPRNAWSTVLREPITHMHLHPCDMRAQLLGYAKCTAPFDQHCSQFLMTTSIRSFQQRAMIAVLNIRASSPCVVTDLS